jgi:hypothetical protein
MAMSVFPSLKCFTHLLTLLTPTHADISIHTTKSLVDDCCRVSVFHKKFKDCALTKRHVGESHFLAAHGGNKRGAHPLYSFMSQRKDAANGRYDIPTQFLATLLC